MHLSPLPYLLIEPSVRRALEEDLGLAGDITANAVIPENHHSSVVMATRKDGMVAGLDAAALSFLLTNPTITIIKHVIDGTHVNAGDKLATISGPSRSILTGERTALNFLSHLSGIATTTANVVAAVSHTKATIVCTRKTTPGLRALEKYAVRAGGGANHRFSLADAVLIKDNHIAISGGINAAICNAKKNAGHLVKIEVEVDTIEQLREAIDAGVDAVLLDNMTPDMLAHAVGIVDRRAITEASGGITPETASVVAKAGVDLISIGWLTHSAPVLDIGLDFITGNTMAQAAKTQL